MTLEDVKNDEKALVDELRRRMKGNMIQEMYEDDSVFQRFLRARNNDLDAAETMLRNESEAFLMGWRAKPVFQVAKKELQAAKPLNKKPKHSLEVDERQREESDPHINWRKRYRVDKILTEYEDDEVLSKYLTLNRLGYDKDGCPVFYSQVGNLDTRGLTKSTNKKKVYLYVIHFVESHLAAMKEQSAKLGKPVEKWSYIINYTNFSLSTATHKPALEMFANLITLYDHNYPERLKTAYLINGSLALTLAFTILKPFISGPTVKKIQLFGKDGWQNALQKNIGLDIIPAFLGGRLTDPDGDPLCLTIIKYGGIVEESHFTCRKSVCEEWMLSATKLVVGRMSKAEVKLEVLYPDSKIEWEFFIKNKDIGFSLFYRGKQYSDTEIEELVPRQRIETDLSSEAGMILCDKPGIYVIEFDNRYSWMYSKEIHYTVTVVNTQNQKTE